MKTITVTEETVEYLDRLGVEYIEGNTVYKIDWYDIRTYFVGFTIGIVFAIIMKYKVDCF